MAGIHTAARRKPATYGRASRKALCDKSSSCAFSPSPSTVTKLTPASESAISKSNLNGSLVSPHHSARASQRTKDLLKTKQSLAGVPQPPDQNHHGRTRRRADSVRDWDLSSSDIDHTGANSAFPGARKKRKHFQLRPAAVAIEQPSTNNQSLSLFAASKNTKSQTEPLPYNLSSHRHLPPQSGQASIDTNLGEGAGSNEILGPATARDRKSYDAEVLYRPLTSEFPPSVSRQSTKAADPACSIEANEIHTSSTNSRRAIVRTPNRKARGHYSLPSTPCIASPTRTPVEANTLHQRELWGMLLPETENDRSLPDGASIRTRTASRSSADCDSAITKSAGVTDQNSSLVSTPRRRPRIIDILQLAKRKLEQSPIQRNEHEVLSGSDSGDLPSLDEDLSPRVDSQLNLLNAKCSETSAPRDNTTSPSIGQHRVLPSNGLKVTYSSQRSHLATNDTDGVTQFDVHLAGNDMSSDDPISSKLVRDKASTFHQSALEVPRLGATDSSQSFSMRTIHELRESGETVRQLNEMGALFDDLDGLGLTSPKLRRGKLLEIAIKQQEPACCRLLFDHGFINRLLTMTASSSDDTIIGTLLAATMLHLVAAPLWAQADSILKDPLVADLFASRLQEDQDLIHVVRNRRSNISKRCQSDLEKFFSALIHSDIWRGGTPTKLSGRVIGLQGLEYLVRRGCEPDSKADILSLETIRRVLDVLPSLLGTPAIRSSANLLFEARLTLSILESCTISGAKHDDNQWNGNTLAPVLAILPWLNQMSFTEIDQAQRSVLRLYLNLTNNNAQICHEFAKSDVIRSISGVIAALDTLILALGTLINLVEWSSTVRDILITKNNEEACSLEILVGLFTARLKMVSEVCSEEGTSSNVAFGYLSVLLAYLSVDEEAREVVANQLEGRNLQPLLIAVEEFLQYHRQIGEDLKDEEADLKTSFIGRLKSVIARL
ncbi:MAG: hypothetical protein Q9197_005055 [Variospora fuerteventurae]